VYFEIFTDFKVTERDTYKQPVGIQNYPKQLRECSNFAARKWNDAGMIAICEHNM